MDKNQENPSTAEPVKRGPGRPRAVRPKVFRGLMADDQEWAAWHEASAGEGQTLSAWARAVLNKAARRLLGGKKS